VPRSAGASTRTGVGSSGSRPAGFRLHNSRKTLTVCVDTEHMRAYVSCRLRDRTFARKDIGGGLTAAGAGSYPRIPP
jgi:hypothetical protein